MSFFRAADLFAEPGVILPTGVSVFAFELEACDTSAAGQVTLTLFNCEEGSCYTLGSVGTGVAETPGCTRFFLPLVTPHTVDTTSSRLTFEFSNSTLDVTTRILAARIGYYRQVSPAPGTASFGDVPVGSPLHHPASRRPGHRRFPAAEFSTSRCRLNP